MTRAHVTIDVTGKSVGTIADEIMGVLGESQSDTAI